MKSAYRHRKEGYTLVDDRDYEERGLLDRLGGNRITYLGHATFRLTTAGGEQILIDPFLTDNPQTPGELKQLGELDAILITHGHFDHFSNAIPLAQQAGATAVANFEIFAYLQS